MAIPDGETTSPPFTITGQSDGTYDADETVTIRASADGFAAGSNTLVVTNIDPAPDFLGHYDFGPTSSVVAAGFELVTHTNAMWQPGANGLGSVDRGRQRANQSQSNHQGYN